MSVLRIVATIATADMVTEPWGVRRFFVRDPLGELVNILQHVAPEAG